MQRAAFTGIGFTSQNRASTKGRHFSCASLAAFVFPFRKKYVHPPCRYYVEIV